jgi:polyhydroxyalkanoate synthesis regulator phasin
VTRVAPALPGAILLVLLVATAPAAAQTTVGRSFPPDFPVPVDASLDQPVIGFGAAGPVMRTPVIFLHGNNDTPYPTDCNGAFGKIASFAQFFLDHGYAASELWGLGYQGEQCDLLTTPTNRSGVAHSTVANVPDLRAFVDAVLAYTGASQVDIVGHSLGTTLTREWLRQDGAYGKVRRLVGVDGPNHGIINCSPSPLNYYALPPAGGFNPDSAICQEYGAGDTPLLAGLNAGDETPAPTEYLMVVNADTSFVYFEKQDGLFAPVPAQNRTGAAHDFSRSARLEGAHNVEVTGQGRYDQAAGAAHLGIVNSPEVWQMALDFLTAPPPQPVTAAPAPPAAEPAPAAAAAPAPPPPRRPRRCQRPAPAPCPSASRSSRWPPSFAAARPRAPGGLAGVVPNRRDSPRTNGTRSSSIGSMTSFTAADLDRLLGLLREHPEQRAQFRALLADEATARLTAIVEALAEAQQRTEERLGALTERVDALAERVDALAERVDALADAQRRTDAQLAALAERVDRLAHVVDALTRQVEALTGQVSALTGHVDWLRGDAIERRYRERPHTYLNAIAHRMHLLTPRELDALLDPAVERGDLSTDEANQIRAADGVFQGRRTADGTEVYVVLEASVGVGLRDVVRARERADLLARTRVDTAAVVGGTWIVPEAVEAARAHGVWQIADGRTEAPAA